MSSRWTSMDSGDPMFCRVGMAGSIESIMKLGAGAVCL